MPYGKMAERGFRNALAEGVTIGCGSDVGPFPHGENARELVWMTSLGMSPAEKLLAATAVDANILGKEHELGSLKRGYPADLIAVAGSPSDNVSSLETVRRVMKGGVVHRLRDG